MYLKSLEVLNFKSFKGEVTVPLDRGFTAITGPNGSGKSNCGDAIQFVLGPKSNRVIRAQNSTDLIFNGGKNSKPARDCSVTLVFANPVMSNGRRRLPLDKEEIRMSRSIRLTASNNPVTTYKLNGEDSTQKVFHRLLGAANARPDGYNIVLQGDVTSLAKMTANERRKVLDNVAGVTSYDDEIRKANKQKEMVENYLDRIGLLEKEQLERLSTLAKERHVAQQAKEVSDAIQMTNAMLLQSRYATMKNELKFHIEQRQKYLDESQDLLDDHKATEKTLLELDDKIAEIQKEINLLTGGETSELGQAIQALQVAIELNNDRLLEAAREEDEEDEEALAITQQLDEAKEELETFITGLQSANEALAEALNELQEAQDEEQRIRAALATAGEQNQHLTDALASAESVVQTHEQHRQEAQTDVDKLAVEADLVGDQLAKAQQESEEIRLALGELDIRLQEMAEDAPEYDRASLAQQLNEAQRAESQLAEDRTRIEIKLREAERSLSLAKAEMEQKSGAKGLAGGASAVLAARDNQQLQGIIGTVAELCAPKDSSHDVSLATAIGAGMASVVVETDQDAANAIRWLAENRAGRATFLPLNKLASSRAGGKTVMTARKDGVLGFAHEMLDYDPRIDVAVRFVLRNTLIVENMSIARKHMGGTRFVTLRGDVIESGGAMVGGAKRKMNISFGGRIQGATEVEKYTAEVEKYHLMERTVSEALREARTNQQSIRNKINAMVDDTYATELRELKAEKKQVGLAHRKAMDVVAGLEGKLDEVRLSAQEAIRAFDAADRTLTSAQEAHEAAKSALEAASPEHLRERMHAANLLRVKATGAKEKSEEIIASGASHQTVLQRRVDETQLRLETLHESKEARMIRVDELEATLATDKVALKAKKDEQAVYLEENQGLEQERQELSDQRATLRVRNEDRLNQAQNHRRLAEELMRTISEKEAEVQLMAQELIQADLSLEDLPDDLKNVGELERQLRGLQRKMDNFGNVNMMAIEQYDECQARLDLMKDEFATLQSRRKHLIEVTEQLESQRKERLLNVLEKVNENFKKSYHELSDGGRGELFLENPDEPFKGGLELWAQPRGKSSKVSRQQLSGGEQSMAALALIFAIQDYDPSPFYYFDEVDQNLDAYNAERIAKMCRKRSKRAQFIMVTLRKVSLKLADHHIGITHGGDGCSRRILDFDRERAIALGEAALKEAQKDAAKNESRIMDAVAAAEDMPTVPDPLSVPKSLGGLLSHMHEDAAAEAPLGGLMERTQELTEDINERAEVASKIAEEENVQGANAVEVPETTVETDEQ
ncbi:MAG TPA: chromosome segregation protein SMC [Candidatus Poseidoniales archaeon]|nr:MAG TPA: chromosome segregation protein SMC [Candidatus Poseidoniales archaeon]